MSSIASRPPRTSRARRRPVLVVEAMERRELMAAKVAHQAVAATPQPPILVAALGDSLTDEYTFGNTNSLAGQSVNRGTARNWVSTLMALRMGQLSFGEYSTVDRGGSRGQGFAQDWALGGEPAVGTDVAGKGVTFINQYAGFPGTSIPGMLTQTPNASGDVDPKSIKVVTIYIGTNDYNLGLTAYATSNGQFDVFDAKTGASNVVNARVEDAVTAAVGKIRTTIPNARIVVVTPQEVTASPLLAKYGTVPGLFAKVSGSLATLNTDMARIAKKQKLGFVNTQAMMQQMGSTPTVAGQPINPQGVGPDLDDEYVPDGFHLGTLVSGKIAQAVVKQIDTLYNKNVVTPISDSDILLYARAVQTGLSMTRTPSPTDPTRSTLTAGVISGVGNGSTPTGTVTFDAVGTATAANPMPSEMVLGTVAVDATGRATLDVANSVADTSSITAIYSGDELHDSRASAALAPSSFTT